MDKFIVRASIVILNIYILITLIYAFLGELIVEYDFLFSSSLMSGILLTTLCHSQGKYHCVYMRVMCYNIIFTPAMNFLDYKYQIFSSAEEYIYVSCATMLLTIISTLFLAIRHFRKVKKLKRQRNEIH